MISEKEETWGQKFSDPFPNIEAKRVVTEINTIMSKASVLLK